MSESTRTNQHICDCATAAADNVSLVARVVAEKLVELAGLVATEQTRPSALYRPTLTQDGNAWLAVYGDFPTGVVGCGDTPAAAMADFDAAWLKPAQSRKGSQV